MEISFFAVPNIDEVSFGTAINKAFGTEVAKDLGMGEYKPGSTIRTYLVQYSNIYWAKKVCKEGLVLVLWVDLLPTWYDFTVCTWCAATGVDRGAAYCCTAAAGFRAKGAVGWKTKPRRCN